MDDSTIFDKIHEVDLKKTMEESYIDYAMSVIAARALPDVRDGLKPVQRRILHSIRDLRNKIIIKMQAQSNNSLYFRICGTCAKITAVNTSTQPTISRGANTSCNTTNPPSTANTDSRLITMDATAGSAYFCPAI